MTPTKLRPGLYTASSRMTTRVCMSTKLLACVAHARSSEAVHAAAWGRGSAPPTHQQAVEHCRPFFLGVWEVQGVPVPRVHVRNDATEAAARRQSIHTPCQRQERALTCAREGACVYLYNGTSSSWNSILHNQGPADDVSASASPEPQQPQQPPPCQRT